MLETISSDRLETISSLCWRLMACQLPPWRFAVHPAARKFRKLGKSWFGWLMAASFSYSEGISSTYSTSHRVGNPWRFFTWYLSLHNAGVRHEPSRDFVGPSWGPLFFFRSGMGFDCIWVTPVVLNLCLDLTGLMVMVWARCLTIPMGRKFQVGEICKSAWWWLEHDWIMTFHMLGISSSQLTNSYFSER